MAEKTFDEVMQEIAMGLTRDPEHDIPYLQERSEQYKDHPLSQEILRACGRLMWDALPDERRQELEIMMGNYEDTAKAVLDEVVYNVKMGNPAKALELIEPLSRKYDDLIESGWCKDDSESVYFNFDSPLEELLWRIHHEGDERTVRRATEPFARTFMMHGSVLFELGRHREAIDQLEKAIRWNPSNNEYRFELGENYKKLGETDAYARILDELFPYIANPQMMARFHRSKGFMYIDLGRYELAAAHLVYSMLFQQTDIAMSELMYIKMDRGEDYTDMTPQVAENVLERVGELLSMDEGAATALVTVINLAREHGAIDMAAQAAGDLYGLTGDEQIGKLARSLVEALGEK